MAKYSYDELNGAFTRVQNPVDWKLPINTVVEKGTDIDLLDEAIIHFTGSLPSFHRMSDGRILVQSVGYYNAVGV